MKQPRYTGLLAKLREEWGGHCVMCGVPHKPPVWKLEFAHKALRGKEDLASWGAARWAQALREE